MMNDFRRKIQHIKFELEREEQETTSTEARLRVAEKLIIKEEGNVKVIPKQKSIVQELCSTRNNRKII